MKGPAPDMLLALAVTVRQTFWWPLHIWSMANVVGAMYAVVGWLE